MTVEEDVLNYMGLSVLSLSLFCSLFIIVMYILFSNLRSFAFKLIFFLNLYGFISDFVFLLSQTLPTPSQSDSFLCQFQAFIINYTSLCTITWSNVISWSLLATCIYDIRQIKSYEKYFHMFTHILSTSLSFVPVFANVYSKTGEGWCWINEKRDSLHFVFMFICYYGPSWLSILFIFGSYVKVIRYLKSAIHLNQPVKYAGGYVNIESLRASEEEPPEVRTLKKLIYYPGAMLICVIFPTINRIYTLSGGKPSFVLDFLHTLFGDLQGFFNAVIYGLNESVKETLLANLRTCKIFPCLAKKKKKKVPSKKVSLLDKTLENPQGAGSNDSDRVLIANAAIDPDDEPSEIDDDEEQEEKSENEEGEEGEEDEEDEGPDGQANRSHRRGQSSSNSKKDIDPGDIYFINSLE